MNGQRHRKMCSLRGAILLIPCDYTLHTRYIPSLVENQIRMPTMVKSSQMQNEKGTPAHGAPLVPTPLMLHVHVFTKSWWRIRLVYTWSIDIIVVLA